SSSKQTIPLADAAVLPFVEVELALGARACFCCCSGLLAFESKTLLLSASMILNDGPLLPLLLLRPITGIARCCTANVSVADTMIYTNSDGDPTRFDMSDMWPLNLR